MAKELPFEVIEAGYAALYKVLKPRIILYDRPVYLKQDEWVKRQERFEHKVSESKWVKSAFAQ